MSSRKFAYVACKFYKFRTSQLHIVKELLKRLTAAQSHREQIQCHGVSTYSFDQLSRNVTRRRPKVPSRVRGPATRFDAAPQELPCLGFLQFFRGDLLEPCVLETCRPGSHEHRNIRIWRERDCLKRQTSRGIIQDKQHWTGPMRDGVRCVQEGPPVGGRVYSNLRESHACERCKPCECPS